MGGDCRGEGRSTVANQETLLSPSNVLLYGRVVRDLRLAPTESLVPPRLGGNNFLQRQLQDPDARLARIYGFSYEGHYYDLTSPKVFLVHGDGVDPEAPRPAEPRVSRAPADADLTGVAGRTGSFSEDIKVWSYDKGDFTIRLDFEIGPFEQVLLEAQTRPDNPHSFSGRMETSQTSSEQIVRHHDYKPPRA